MHLATKRSCLVPGDLTLFIHQGTRKMRKDYHTLDVGDGASVTKTTMSTMVGQKSLPAGPTGKSWVSGRCYWS
jgi:hypothetical protein